MTAAGPSHASLLRTLAAAVTDPGLHSILLFDAEREQLAFAEDALRELLSTFLGERVDSTTMAAYHREADLWGDGIGPTQPRGGLLVTLPDQPWRVVVIPDLSTLAVDGLRACVELMGSPTAEVQRHGVKLRYRPRIFWLAACARDAIGVLSKHLLERFALRLQAPEWRSAPLDRLRAIVRGLPFPVDAELLEKARRDVARLRNSLLQGDPTLTAQHPEFLASVEEALGAAPAQGVRRQLSLARFAAAIARLEGQSASPVHVMQAVRILGAGEQKLGDLSEMGERFGEAALGRSSDDAHAGAPTLTPSTADQRHDGQYVPGRTAKARIAESNLQHVFEAMAEELSGAVLEKSADSELPLRLDAKVAFPEDRVSQYRDHAALRRTPARRSGGRGPIVGTRHAERPEETAAFPTLHAAAFYQRVRQRHSGDLLGSRFIVRRSDLRAWRRGHVPERLLIVVLDVTAARGLLGALAPFLRRAYADRSPVRVVSVGGQACQNELQARVISARGVLDPDLRRALEQAPARATPLAHGFKLASRVVRAHCNRGRGATNSADVVVITDGLANVPLAASEAGRMLAAVSRQGIDDALVAASELRHLRSTEVFLVAPVQPKSATVLDALADALGAQRVLQEGSDPKAL